MVKRTVFLIFYLLFSFGHYSYSEQVIPNPLIDTQISLSDKSVIKSKSSIMTKNKNHLVNEKSPYLLQHADNPVHWYPWGEEAFNKAKQEDKPVFLSIGYSTCHWCHVMEHESFENQEIADILNKYFISVKVDREERPDIDNVYMKVVIALTGSGGWPLTVFITPDKKPFWGGTYFPPESRWGRPGLKELLLSLNDSWQNRRDDIYHISESVTDEVFKHVRIQSTPESTLDKSVFDIAFKSFNESYDVMNGGFGYAPKFPSGQNLSFLLRYYKRTGNRKALDIAETTLNKMLVGGIYDQLGGGFHRYSTDSEWFLPHFEKMLYDQAVLSKTYLEAYQVTKNKEYSRIVKEIFEYVLEEMTDVNGGFYSAEDADSLPYDSIKKDAEKAEGAFYVWDFSQLKNYLSKEELQLVEYYYGIKQKGNVSKDPHEEFKGKNVLSVTKTIPETVKYLNKSESELSDLLISVKNKLLKLRNEKPRPHLDDKVLVDWNGMMISSFAFGSRVLNEPKYVDAAEKAANFILENLVRKDGRLLHRYRVGDAAILGNLDDYAFFINGLLDLYEATFNVKYLVKAEELAQEMIRLFWDKEEGGFFFTGEDSKEILFKHKELYDGAKPSGSGVASLVLIRLYEFTLNKTWEDKAFKYFSVFSEAIESNPSVNAQSLIAFDFAVGPTREIVIAEGKDDQQVEVMIKEIFDTFLPNKVVILKPVNDLERDKVISVAPFTEYQVAIDDLTTAYVCINHVCRKPTSDMEVYKRLLREENK